MPETIAKPCSICGIDCAGKPRVKDPKGHYICKDCFEKAKETRKALTSPPPASSTPSTASAAPALDDNSFLLNLGDKNAAGMTGTKPCPECGRALNANAVICVGCGYNLESGKRTQVKVIKAKQPKAERSERRTSMVINYPLVVGGLVGGLMCLAGFTLIENAAEAAMAILATAFVFAVWSGTLVLMFQDSVLGALASIFIPFVYIYWLFLRLEGAPVKILNVAAWIVWIGLRLVVNSAIADSGGSP
jgi:uncharacterized membrane protein